MTGEEFYKIRQGLRLSQLEMGRMCGLEGEDRNTSDRVIDWEKGERSIPRSVARLVSICGRHGFYPIWTKSADGEWDTFDHWFDPRIGEHVA